MTRTVEAPALPSGFESVQTAVKPAKRERSARRRGHGAGKTKVAVVGTVGLPARYGGFETLAHYLVEHLSGEFEFTVYCSGPDYRERPREFMGAKLVYLPVKANGAQSILFDILNYIHAWRTCDALIILGVSGGIAMPVGRLLGKPSILNIGGMEWQRNKWGRWARRYLRLAEIIGVLSADRVVSDNLGIRRHLKDSYGRDSALIEYGGDQVSSYPIHDRHLEKYPFLAGPYAFALARIQSDNNPELILHAFNQIPEVNLVFIGTWSRSAYGRELKQRYERYPNLRLLEAIYDPEELNVIRSNCAYYVHGHSAGGTNPALVEAMHLGLPIASFDVIYNRATTENRVRYFRNVAGLAELVLKTPQSEWDAQRPVVKEIAVRRYGWKRIAEEYARVIREVARTPARAAGEAVPVAAEAAVAQGAGPA